MPTRKKNIMLSTAPALLVYKRSPEKAAEKGVILFYHGLKACKENNLKELRSLANNGFLAVGIDNAGHGERLNPDFKDLLSSTYSFERNFIDMVRRTVSEIPLVIESLISKGLADPHKIGVSGISMGGHITYGSILADTRIKVTAPILGSPKWNSPDNFSPYNFPERFYPTALLAQNAGKDHNVPPRYSREFCKILRPFYNDYPERLKYIEFPHSGHFMKDNEWEELWNNVIGWFEKFLP